MRRNVRLLSAVWAQRGGGRGALALLECVECDGQVGSERALHNRCW